MIGLKKKIKLPKRGSKNGKDAKTADGADKKVEDRNVKLITIDNYSENYYKFENGTIFPLRKLAYSNSHLNITYIANKDMIIAPIELSRGIPDDSIDGALEDKAYEELGLDPAVEYIIKYIETSSQAAEDNRVFQLFILEEDKYYELFSNLREEIKYVDFIVPAPLLYKSLYDHEVLEKNELHCFLYFGSYDATIVFYRNGEYLYSKSINYSLKQIYERYCEIVGKTIDENEFFTVFQKEGIKTSNIEYQQNFIKLFNEIFITVNDIVIYTKRAYKIDVIDHMYIGSEIGPISGIEDYAQNYLGMYAIPMLLDYGFQTQDTYVDQYHCMMVLTAISYIEHTDEPYLINYTKYKRPPVFYKRPSGQFAISIVAAIILASAYPVSFLIMAYMNEAVIYKKKKEEIPIGKEVRKYKQILASKQREKKRLNKILKDKKTLYDSKEKTLVQVYRKKVFYRLQSEQLALFANDMKAYNVKTDYMRSDYSKYRLGLISDEDERITNFVKGITQKYDKEIENINIAKIYMDDNSSLYRGELKVDLK